jgi:hypothetical protein
MFAPENVPAPEKIEKTDLIRLCPDYPQPASD